MNRRCVEFEDVDIIINLYHVNRAVDDGVLVEILRWKSVIPVSGNMLILRDENESWLRLFTEIWQ